MKKTKTRLLAALLCASMAELPAIPVVAAEDTSAPSNEQVQRYEIYPIPQSVSYAENPEEFTVTGSVNVVYESGIDQYTKDYLNEILEENGLRASTSDAIVSNQTNILIGVDDSNGAADEWFDANEQLSADLFSKTDAYAIGVDAQGETNVIAIVGKDTDAAFYGLSSLEMMFSSFEGNKLIETVIEDYADKELRGFIEGFYGGFTYEGRESQIRFLRTVKGNMYVFASKTDPYHGGSSWQNTYPADELNRIAHLVSVAKANKVRYAWSFHTGKSNFFANCSSDPSSDTYSVYQQRLNTLFTKFQQLYDIGVRDFHILNDDYNSGSPDTIARFLNDVNAWLKEKGDCGPLVYCPINYNITWSSEANVTAELNAYKALDDDILLYWTGERVNSPIKQSDVDWAYERSNHEIINWINYPCSEHDKAGLYLGSIYNYFSEADDLQHTKGLMSNPVNYPEANKVAYFQLMSWLWNTHNYAAQADTIWKNSFKYIEPEVADSYALVARHISNCPDSGRYPNGFPESEDLREALERTQTKLLDGHVDLNDPDIKAVYDEMKAVVEAIADLRANGREELLTDIGPWLNSLESVANALIGEIDAFAAIEDQNASKAWSDFAKAAAALEGWAATPTTQYAEKSAKAGSLRLQPAASRLLTALSDRIRVEIDPDYDEFTPSVISSYARNDSSQNMIDGDESTYASWNIVQSAGDYYGVDLGRVLHVNNIEIIQGQTDTHHDRFHESTLEYSLDGENWTAIEENINSSRIVRTNLDFEAKYVRLRVTGFSDPNQPNKSDFWTRVREFTVNKKAEEPAASVWSDQEASGNATVSLNDQSIVLSGLDGLVLEAGKSIGISLSDPVFASAVEKSATAASGLQVEYSLDGLTWSTDPISTRETIRFARLHNTSSQSVTLTASDSLTITKTEGAQASVSSDLPLKEGSWSNLIDGDTASYIWTNTNQAAGQTITIDLNRELPFNALSIYMAENRPRLYHGTLSVSTDGETWTPALTVDAANDDTVIDGSCRYKRVTGDGSLIRYIKLEVTDSAKEESTEHSAFLKLHEIRLNDADLPVDVPSLFTGGYDNLSLAADADLSTAFSAPANASGSFEYVVAKNADRPFLTFVQDAQALSNARVEVLEAGSTEWKTLGTLDEPVTRFAVNENGGAISKVRVSWDGDQPLKLYEILMTSQAAETETLDIASVERLDAITCRAGSTVSSLSLPGRVRVTLSDSTARSLEVVWNTDELQLDQAGTYVLEGTFVLPAGVENPKAHKASLTVVVEESRELRNLALNQPVTSSGTEVSDGRWTADLVVDGDAESADSRWSSPLMKNGTAADQTQTQQWLQIDLGTSCSIESIRQSFYLKVYATDYDIQVSEDGETWTTVKENAGLEASTSTTNPIDTVEFDTPVSGRYVKFIYNAINHNAGGNALSVWEIEVYGWENSAAAADKSQLKTVIDKSESLDLSDYSLTDVQQEAWAEAIATARGVYNQFASQNEINEAARTLNQKLLALRMDPEAEKLGMLPSDTQ